MGRFLFTLSSVFLLGVSAFGQTPSSVNVYLADFAGDRQRTVLETSISELLSELNQSYLNDQLDISASSISEIVGKVWETSTLYIPDSILILEASKTTSGLFEVRNIPAYFIDGEQEVYDEIAVEIRPNGEISDFTISLPEHQYVELLSQSTTFIDEKRRKVILDFTEDFRTAYNTQNLDFIESVFSEQALIIVGNVVEQDSESPLASQVEYLKFTKTEYIDRLKRVFRNNEFIDVTFENIDIIQHPKYDYMYGVNMEQYYASSTYADEGYLFLLIDFSDEENPLIHVRTWQPLQVIQEGSQFSLGDMNIIL